MKRRFVLNVETKRSLCVHTVISLVLNWMMMTVLCVNIQLLCTKTKMKINNLF